MFGSTSTVEVLVNGTLAFTETNATPSTNTVVWQQFQHTIVATGPTTPLAFRNADPGSDNNNGIDNVVLVDLGPSALPVATGVPTLSEWPLILTAALLALLAAGRLRGRRR